MPQFSAVGLLGCLWTWALNNAPDGDLSRFPKQAIARECYWNKSADTLLNALIACGWVDDELHIHDWNDYAGRLIDRREQNAERKRKSRARHTPVTRDDTATGDDRHRATVPNRTKPNITVPNQTVVDEERARDVSGLLTDSEAQSLADGIQAVLDAAKRAGFPDTQADWDKCNALVADYGADAVLKAISICTDRPLDKRNYGYLRGVLERDPAGGKLPGKPPDKTGKGYNNPFVDLARKYEEEGV